MYSRVVGGFEDVDAAEGVETNEMVVVGEHERGVAAHGKREELVVFRINASCDFNVRLDKYHGAFVFSYEGEAKVSGNAFKFLAEKDVTELMQRVLTGKQMVVVP